MNSRRGGVADSVKGKSIDQSLSGKGAPQLDVLTAQMSETKIGPQEDGWEVYGKKSKKPGPGAVKQSGQGSSSNAAPNAWGPSEGVPRQQVWGPNGSSRTSGNNWVQPADHRKPGRGNPRPPNQSRWESPHPAPQAVAPPLANGWQWAAKRGPSGPEPESRREAALPQQGSSGYESDPEKPDNDSDDDDDDPDDLEDDSDDDASDDDLDAVPKTFESRKQNKWFKAFFEGLDKLSVEEINQPARQWHCPACQNGPGAIDWYKGLQPLVTHAKTKGATRVKLHRELAQLLEEELYRRGTSAVPAGEQFGKWKGLKATAADHEIVWPPMVVIRNTLLELDENDKWTGMGNQELLEYFRSYAATRARHSYGPRGHRGLSLLIFDNSAMGYMEAERLHRHFVDQGTDRDAWNYRKVLFLPGGKRQLYGHLATKEDMEDFNRHCQGKSKLRYEMKSYHENVVIPMKQMSEDNQQLTYLKNKVVKQEQRSKAVEATLGVVSQKLRETMEENRIVRLRTKIQHEENKEEMDYQEQFFKEQLDKIQQSMDKKEMDYEKVLQEERAKAKQSDINLGSTEERRHRQEEIDNFLNDQVKGVKEFELERDDLVKAHEEKKKHLKNEFEKIKLEYMAKEVELEETFATDYTMLMEKYKPNPFEAPSSSS